MKTSEIKKIVANTNDASKDFDDYNTVVKTHTVTIGEHSMACDEVRSGHIKINGTEQFPNYEEMEASLHSGAKVETVEL